MQGQVFLSNGCKVDSPSHVSCVQYPASEGAFTQARPFSDKHWSAKCSDKHWSGKQMDCGEY